MAWLRIVALVLVVVTVGVFVRYGSGHPCDWLLHDMAAKSGLPRLAIQGVLAAQFAGEEPTVRICLGRWADLHVNGVEDQLWNP